MVDAEKTRAKTERTMAAAEQMQAQTKRAQLEFLKVELQTSLTFALRALATHDADARIRNQQNARIGYDTILDTIAKHPIGQADTEEFRREIERLRAQLRQLGEVL